MAGTYGSVTINSDGSYSYTLNDADADTNALAQGASVTDVFSYTVTDEHGATSTANLTITITGTNDGPVAVADTNAGDAVNEAGVQPAATRADPGDASASGNVLTNDSDVDTGAVLTVSAVTARHGRVGARRHLWLGHDQQRRQLQLHARQCRYRDQRAGAGRLGHRCVQLHGDRRARRDLDREPDDHHHRHQ